MNKAKNQKGFSVIEVVLVIFVVALIAVVGWLVLDKQKTSNSQANTDTTKNTDNSNAQNSSSAVEIQEWDIKLNTTYAAKLTYEVLNENGTLEFSNESYDSIVTFKIKPELLTDKECGPGVNLYRLAGSPEDNENSVKIGDRYYTTFGAPGICDNDADTDLKTSIAGDIKVENIEAL